MSAPEPPLTTRELLLLTAISRILDIPYPASWQDREHFEMTLRERVYRLLGVLDKPSAAGLLNSLETIAARPLGYKPESEE